MGRIRILYSEDFRNATKVNEVCGRLRDRGFDPKDIIDTYSGSSGEGFCDYYFVGTKLPSQESLETMFEGILLQGIQVLD